MARIINRRHGRTEESSRGQHTHLIKIGWDIRKEGADRPQPGKLPGFLICRNSQDGGGHWIIDWPAMQALGAYTAEKFQQAVKMQLKAGPDLLPQELRFVILSDAIRDAEGNWHYPDTISEEYECWNKSGLFCHGNGLLASRKAEGGGRVQGTCNPVGKAGVHPDKYCEYSARKECKDQSRLNLFLYAIDREGKPRMLAPTLGRSARYRLETTSEYNNMGFMRELDAAANRLHAPDLFGNRALLNGITGMLMFSIVKRVNPTGGKGLCQQIIFILDEESIRAREREIQAERDKRANLRLEYHKEGMDTKLLDAPPSVVPVPASPLEKYTPSEAERKARVAEAQRQPVFESEPEDDDPPTHEQMAAELAGVENAVNAPEPEPHPADTEDPIKLVAALDGYVEAVGQRDLVDNEVVWRRIASFKVSGREYFATGPDWFLQHEKGDPNKHAFRIRLLRDICRELWEDPLFEVVTLAEEVVDAADAEVAS